MSQGLILFGAYFLLFVKKKKERKGRNSQEAFFLGHTHPIDCAAPGFSLLLGAIKSCFKCQSLNFMYI
jgi:hypothetical protein